MMKRIAMVVLLTAAACRAATVDEVLDALHQRGLDMKSFRADIALKTDNGDETGSTILGVALYQIKPNGIARVFAQFDRKILGLKQTSQPKPEPKKIYLLDDGWLTDRDYKVRNETRRQVANKDQKVNLFELGKGLFPLPIGQDKSAVHKLFDAELVAPVKDDPADTDHLLLKPLPKSAYAEKYSAVDIWVDRKSHMPVRVKTLDTQAAVEKTTDFGNLVINPALTDADFKLDDVTTLDGAWTTHDEPMK